jgi:hypothetical protein
MLTQSQARAIAESLWGRGGTHVEKTNRAGAHYFGCSGHGGFVIDADAFTQAERDALQANGFMPEAYKAWHWRRGGRTHYRLMWPERRRGGTVAAGAHESVGSYYVFEEDCDWSAVYVLTGVRHLHREASAEAARGCFDRWIAPRLAAVAGMVVS